MKKTVFRERFRRIAAAILITVLTFLLLSCGSSSKPAGREENRSDQVSSGSGDNKSAESFQVEFTYNTDVVGEPPAAQKVTEGDLLEMPYVAPVTGYKLLGWVREDRPAYPYDFSLPVTKSFRLTGIWLDTSLDMTDTDQDELSDALEEMLRTDPSGWDTDNDGLPDGMELLQLRLDPLSKDTDGDSISDGEEDTDEDKISNLSELENVTNPAVSDTDTDGLYDGEELNVWQTDPLDVDTDSDGVTDGVEVEIGSDPLTAERIFTTSLTGDEISEHHPVSIAVSSVTDAKGAGSLAIDELINTHIPALTPASYGYLAPAYELTTSGNLDHAVITFSYDPALGEYSEEFMPTIYWYNEEESEFVEVSGQTCENGTVSAEITHFSIYMLLDKAMMDPVTELISDQIGRIAPDLTRDDNNDGLPDEVALLINKGYIKYDNTSLLEGVIDMHGEENDDWDEDGLKNGNEIELGISLFGGLKLKINSNPVLIDSDYDNISDYDEFTLGTDPMIYDHRSVGALSGLMSDSKYLYAIHKENIGDGIARFIDFHKYDEAKDCLINYFYDYAPEASLEANAESIAEYADFCERLKILGLVSDIASIYKSVYSVYSTDKKISELEKSHFNEVCTDWSNITKDKQKAINEKLDDFLIDLPPMNTTTKQMDELIDALKSNDLYEKSEKITKMISLLSKDLKAYQKCLTYVDFKFNEEFRHFVNSKKALKGSSLKTTSTVLTVACDVLEGVENRADIHKTYGKIRANFEAYNMYLELLLYVRDHAEDIDVKKAAGDLAGIILDNAGGEYERQLTEACLRNDIEITADILLDLGAKTNPYAAIAKNFLDMYGLTGVTNQSKYNVYFEVMTELSKGCKSILGREIRMHDQTFSYDRDKEGDVLKYLVQLAQCRIIGEYYFYEYCSDNSGAGWISSLLSGVPASEYMKRYKNKVENTYDYSNRLQLVLSPNLPHFNDFWNGSVREDTLMIKLDTEQALNKAAGIYVFTSGMGGWETRFVLEKDGTFSGYYTDMYYGQGTLVNGISYDATVFERYFSGRFSIGEQLSDYSCELILEDYTFEGDDGDEWVVDNYGRFRHVNSAAPGLEGFPRFVLYGPSMPKYELPFAAWDAFSIDEEYTIGFGDEEEMKGAFLRIRDKQYSSYSTAYYEFVNSDQYRSDGLEYGTEEEVQSVIRDLEQDGIPELLLTNGYSDSSMQAVYIYTYAYDEINYVGELPIDVYTISDAAYPSVFGKEGDYWYYYYKYKNDVRPETVAEEYPDGSISQITYAQELFLALMRGERTHLFKPE